MSGDRINILPGEVATAGGVVTTEAGEASAAIGPLFDSAHPAALGNPGFSTGPVLVRYCDELRDDFETTVRELDALGREIVLAAQAHQATDAENADGLSRVASALNGLGLPPVKQHQP